MVLIGPENELKQRDNPDFLLEMGELLLDLRVFLQLLAVSVESDCKFAYVPVAKVLKQMEKPLEISSLERVEDVFFKQLGDVVDVFTKQHTHAHLD